MNGKNNGIRSVLCLVLCAVLLGGSFFGGDYIAMGTQAVFRKYSEIDRINSSLSVNKTSATQKENDYAIVGYGGGNYAVSVASNTPTDIETLKAQAQIAFKNYKKRLNTVFSHTK